MSKNLSFIHQPLRCSAFTGLSQGEHITQHIVVKECSGARMYCPMMHAVCDSHHYFHFTDEDWRFGDTIFLLKVI